jgi:hypothetical protein
MFMPPGSARLSSRVATHPIAVYFLVLNHPIAEVDADPKLHSAVRRNVAVFLPECSLNFDRAPTAFEGQVINRLRLHLAEPRDRSHPSLEALSV